MLDLINIGKCKLNQLSSYLSFVMFLYKLLSVVFPEDWGPNMNTLNGGAGIQVEEDRDVGSIGNVFNASSDEKTAHFTFRKLQSKYVIIINNWKKVWASFKIKFWKLYLPHRKIWQLEKCYLSFKVTGHVRPHLLLCHLYLGNKFIRCKSTEQLILLITNIVMGISFAEIYIIIYVYLTMSTI